MKLIHNHWVQKNNLLDTTKLDTNHMTNKSNYQTSLGLSSWERSHMNISHPGHFWVDDFPNFRWRVGYVMLVHSEGRSSEIHHENSKNWWLCKCFSFSKEVIFNMWPSKGPILPVVFFSNFCFAKKHPWGASYFRSPRVSTTSPTDAGGRGKFMGKSLLSNTPSKFTPANGLFFRGRTVKLPGRV